MHHTKLIMLCRRLKLEQWQAVGLLESIWHVCARQTPAGDLGKLTDEQIALAIGYQENEIVMIDTLVDCGWLDRDSDFRLIVHDWWDHCDDAVHKRLARSHQFFVNGTEPRLTRFSAAEKERLEEWYKSARGAHHGRTQSAPRAHPERPTSAPPEPEPCQSPARAGAPPEPEPRQSPATRKSSDKRERGNDDDDDRARESCKLAAAAVRETHPATDDEMVNRICAAAAAAAAEFSLTLSDEQIADAVDECAKAANGHQRSAAMYLKTVPNVIRTWCSQGKAKPKSPLSEKTNRTMGLQNAIDRRLNVK